MASKKNQKSNVVPLSKPPENQEIPPQEEVKPGKYEHAPDHVLTMAARLIDDHHGHLAEARIKYLFKNGTWKKKGKQVLGQAKCTSEEVRFLGEYDFVIVINANAWQNANEKQRFAVLDHELTHCSCDYDAQDNKRWVTIDHDVNDFCSIVRRHGAWESELQKFRKTLMEISLFEETANDSYADFQEQVGAVQ